MSHIVQIQTEIRDPIAIHAACQRLELSPPEFGTHKLFQNRVTGWGITLPKWLYPVVCQIETGKIQFDNFGGRWGEQVQLDRFLQAYAVEKTKLEARHKGYGVCEHALQDGSIKLVVQVGGVV